MNRFICWLDTVRASLPSLLNGNYPIEGHPYYETYRNDEVQILKCQRCGHYSVGYYIGGEPEPPKP